MSKLGVEITDILKLDNLNEIQTDYYKILQQTSLYSFVRMVM